MRFPLFYAAVFLVVITSCRTPIAGWDPKAPTAEGRSEALTRRAQERGVSTAQQRAADAMLSATSDLVFDLRDPGHAGRARALYALHCKGCHGARGEGLDAAVSMPPIGGFGFRVGMMMSGGKMGRGIYRRIAEGGGRMPGFADRLSSAQIWLLVRFIGTL